MDTPLYSVVIPAFNEELYLEETLKHLKDAMSSNKEPGEIIVVDNNSTDRTAEIACKYGARVVFEPYNQIARARNTGVRAAEGEYILFLDADTLVSISIFEKALNMLQHEGYCGVGVLLSTGTESNKLANAIYGLVNLVCYSLKIAPGCFIFCTREAFLSVGGFNERFYAAEEVWFSNALRAWGKNNGMGFKIMDKPKIKSSPRKLQSPYKAFTAFISLTLLPFTAYFRSLCWYWYKRSQ